MIFPFNYQSDVSECAGVVGAEKQRPDTKGYFHRQPETAKYKTGNPYPVLWQTAGCNRTKSEDENLNFTVGF
ncbi:MULTISPECIES: hypothetical protein [Dickeya]|uniref:Uncharacterized protein n=1 Tax=Dickeya aquatica TaxID=1401087 RepID=A0A375AGZ8_9GAMM|nr:MULTISPECIES: hypothetical protein [Dickeya]SLM65151.1 hypothetical protein DAQ1742_04406 [Dickeya aquatica]